MALKKISQIIEEAGLRTDGSVGAAEAFVKYLIKESQSEVIRISSQPFFTQETHRQEVTDVTSEPSPLPIQLSFDFGVASKKDNGPRSA